MNKEITEHNLQVCIKAYQEDRISDDEILQVFGKLANMVMSYRDWQFENPNDVVAEAADLCLVKLPRYDNSKAKAFNFFTTIIGCYLGQVSRMQMNLRKLVTSRVIR